MDDPVFLHAALVVAGIASGFLNTMAGGGSMLTLPALMLLGLPADVANGTNRLSVVSQSISGVIGFDRGGALDRPSIVRVLAPTVLGSLAGAVAASHVPPDALKIVLLSTMIAMAALMALAPRLISAPVESEPRWDQRKVAGFAGLFVAGLYGGFVQAGVGFVLLAVLGGILRYDVVRANALKLACTLVFGGVALGVFAIAGQVDWLFAVLLAVYTVIGSLLGVRFALHVRHDLIRWIIFACVVATCVAAWLKG
jgi:uncharacterized protein